jgi:hypothetical protein
MLNYFMNLHTFSGNDDIRVESSTSAYRFKIIFPDIQLRLRKSHYNIKSLNNRRKDTAGLK